jgi:hypothetical protein
MIILSIKDPLKMYVLKWSRQRGIKYSEKGAKLIPHILSIPYGLI